MGESRAGNYLEKESWWWNEDIQAAVRNKREAFKTWKATRNEDRETYTSMSKISKTKTKGKAKEKAYEVMYKGLEENGPKKIYKLSKARHRRSKDIDRLTFIRDKEGKIMCEVDNL